MRRGQDLVGQGGQRRAHRLEVVEADAGRGPRCAAARAACSRARDAAVAASRTGRVVEIGQHVDGARVDRQQPAQVRTGGRHGHRRSPHPVVDGQAGRELRVGSPMRARARAARVRVGAAFDLIEGIVGQQVGGHPVDATAGFADQR